MTHFGAPAETLPHLPLGELWGWDYAPDGRRVLATVRRQKKPLPLRLVLDWPTLLER